MQVTKVHLFSYNNMFLSYENFRLLFDIYLWKAADITRQNLKDRKE